MGIICNNTAAMWLLRRFLNKWTRKTRYYNILYKPTQKLRFHMWKRHVTRTGKDAHIGNEKQLQNNSITFIHTNKSLLSATSFLSRLPKVYNTTVSLDKLTWQLSRQIWTIFLVQKWFQLLGCKFDVFKKDDNKKFRLIQNLTMEEADFNQFLRLRNQLVKAAENLAGEESLNLVLLTTMSKDKDEQAILAHKLVDVVDRANRKTCVTLLRYNVEKPESSYPQVQIFTRKKEDESF